LVLFRNSELTVSCAASKTTRRLFRTQSWKDFLVLMILQSKCEFIANDESKTVQIINIREPYSRHRRRISVRSISKHGELRAFTVYWRGEMRFGLESRRTMMVLVEFWLSKFTDGFFLINEYFLLHFSWSNSTVETTKFCR